MAATLILYDYWRSSAAYRVRIALNLKQLPYEQRTVNLIKDGGQQKQADYQALNPQGLVPTLLHDGHAVRQSVAICEYLDQCFPQPALLPTAARSRAEVRAMALLVACDIHPINNLRVLQYLTGPLEQTEAAKLKWIHHWIEQGFSALERILSTSPERGRCCYGNEPTLADLCLIPQVYNAERFDVDLTPYPHIRTITAYCRSLSAFQAAAPEQQPDAVG